jgi:hypothetical protein
MSERRVTFPGMKRASEIEAEQSDFATDGVKSWCKFCGAIKEASAKFYVEHYHECVKPRQHEEGADHGEGR